MHTSGWILPFSIQSTRVAEWLSLRIHFRKGVGGERLLPFTPLFSTNQNRNAVDNELHRKGCENDAEQPRNHSPSGDAHCF